MDKPSVDHGLTSTNQISSRRALQERSPLVNPICVELSREKKSENIFSIKKSFQCRPLLLSFHSHNLRGKLEEPQDLLILFLFKSAWCYARYLIHASKLTKWCPSVKIILINKTCNYHKLRYYFQQNN